MDARLQEKLDALPTEPGVYLMKDRRGHVIYVGKAINLRNRVRSYFTRTGDTRVFVSLLDSDPRRHRDGARPQREGGAPPRERADQEAQAALQRPAQGRQAVHLLAARQEAGLSRGWRSSASTSGTGRATSGPTRAPAPSARRCASSTATSTCAPARTTCWPTASGPVCCTRSAAARRPASTRCLPRSTAAAWTRWCSSWRARPPSWWRGSRAA